MLKKLTAALLVSGLALTAAPAAGAVSQEPRTAGGGFVVPTASKDYTNRQKNRFWNAVKRRDSDARIVGKKDIVEMGTLTCDLLRAGGDLSDLGMLLAQADPIIEDLMTVTMAFAPIYLCPDQDYKFD
jgi:hypothetical protein